MTGTEEPKPRRKIMLVIEEIDDAGHFNIRMEGDCDRIGKTHDEHLSTAEFWMGQIWMRSVQMMKAAGAVGQAAPKKPTLLVP
jgi:hypothetical protein